MYKAKCVEEGPHLNDVVAIKTLKLEAFMSSLEDIIVRDRAGGVAGGQLPASAPRPLQGCTEASVHALASVVYLPACMHALAVVGRLPACVCVCRRRVRPRCGS